jgi:hypothetical protein
MEHLSTFWHKFHVHLTVAFSTFFWKHIWQVVKFIFRRKHMPTFPMTLYKGADGSIILNQINGVLSLAVTGAIGLGGGAAAGVLSATIAMGLQLNAKQAGDLAIALIGAAVPALAPEVAVLKLAYDAEIGKL